MNSGLTRRLGKEKKFFSVPAFESRIVQPVALLQHRLYKRGPQEAKVKRRQRNKLGSVLIA